MTCGRTQEFLASNRIESGEIIDARKKRMGEKDALLLAKQVDEIYAAKGKKVLHLDVRKDRPGADELLNVLLGPTGNLRAPAVRVGRTLIVGFDEAAYRKVLE